MFVEGRPTRREKIVEIHHTVYACVQKRCKPAVTSAHKSVYMKIYELDEEPQETLYIIYIYKYIIV